MAMKKYADSEGPVEVFRGDEAVVVNDLVQKTGKSVADFNDDERKVLHERLDSVKESADKSE